jgi:signal peptidase I
MSRRKQLKSDSEISTTEKIDLIFSQKHTYPVTKSQLLSDNEKKITKFVEDTLRYINSFNYPYEMFYYEKNEEKTCHSILSDESDKSIGDSLKELIKTDKGKEIDEVYFLADKKVIN